MQEVNNRGNCGGEEVGEKKAKNKTKNPGDNRKK